VLRDATQYAQVDNVARLRRRARHRFNVVLSFDTCGLAAFDRSIGACDDRIRNDPASGPTGRAIAPAGRDADRLANRITSLRTLAEATDGTPSSTRTISAGGARRIVNDYRRITCSAINPRTRSRWSVARHHRR
jgi:hypothetical protein